MMGLLEIIMGAGEALKSLGGESALNKGASELASSFNDSKVNKMFSDGMFQGNEFGGQSSGAGSDHFMGFEQTQAQPVDATSAMQSVMSQVGNNPAAGMLTAGEAGQPVTYSLPQVAKQQPVQAEPNPYLEELDKFDEIEAQKDEELKNQGALYQPQTMDLSKPTTLAG